jgi:hypothetical protein
MQRGTMPLVPSLTNPLAWVLGLSIRQMGPPPNGIAGGAIRVRWREMRAERMLRVAISLSVNVNLLVGLHLTDLLGYARLFTMKSKSFI